MPHQLSDIHFDANLVDLMRSIRDQARQYTVQNACIQRKIHDLREFDLDVASAPVLTEELERRARGFDLAFPLQDDQSNRTLADLTSVIEQEQDFLKFKAESLIKGLRDELESNIAGLEDLRDLVRTDQVMGDSALEVLGGLLIKNYSDNGDIPSYKYVFDLSCDHCEVSTPEQTAKSRRTAAVRTHGYVKEDEFRTLYPEQLPRVFDIEDFRRIFRENLHREDSDFQLYCPDCEENLGIKGTRNIAYMPEGGLVHAVVLRVKSAGRYCDKLIDWIFYDPNDERMKRRNLRDRYAFGIVVNPPNNRQAKQIQSRCGHNLFRKRIDSTFGIKIPSDASVEDLVCYDILDSLQIKLGSAPTGVEDYIANSRLRISKDGRKEFYRALHFDLCFRGKRMEGRITPKEAYKRSEDRRSAIHHSYYEDTENQVRAEVFRGRPEVQIVREILLKSVFGGMHYD